MNIIYYKNITFSLDAVHVDPNSENDGYDLAEMPRIRTGHGYDGVDFEKNSNLKKTKDYSGNPAIQNPYYEGLDDGNVNKELMVDTSPEEGDRENIKVIENAYYE